MPDLGPVEIAMLWSMLLTGYLGMPAVVVGVLAFASRSPNSRLSTLSRALGVVAIILGLLCAPGLLVFVALVLGIL